MMHFLNRTILECLLSAPLFDQDLNLIQSLSFNDIVVDLSRQSHQWGECFQEKLPGRNVERDPKVVGGMQTCGGAL